MNTKWFSGIGLAILLSAGTLVYTTTTQARQQAAPTVAADPTLENLTTCATEKNPAYVEGVLKGAMNAFDKEAKAAIKAGKPANFKKAANNLLKVIKFLFVQSKHFSPTYKHEAHKPTFDKDIDKLIQSLFHAEYALAKSQSAQKEVIKDYTALVAELTKDDVSGLTPIAKPSKKAANGILTKMKEGVRKAGSAIAGGAKKAAGKVKAKIAPKPTEETPAAADDSGDALADDAPTDEESLEAVGRQDAQVFEPEADDSGDADPTDDTTATDDSSDSSSEEESEEDGSDSEADDSGDLQTEEDGTFEPEDDAPTDDEEDGTDSDAI